MLTKEVKEDMKLWEELILENMFGLGDHPDHLLSFLAYMLYCIVAEKQYNITYFVAKRLKNARATPKANLTYDMLLTRLFRYIIELFPHLNNGIYNVVDRIMRPFFLVQAHKPRKDRETQRARHSFSWSLVKEKQEKDKIRTKPDRNGKRGKAQQCRRPIPVKKARKKKKIQVQGTKYAYPQSVLIKEQTQALNLQFT
nr:hypothetical protein [Tanacetum cinerariifolium]